MWNSVLNLLYPPACLLCDCRLANADVVFCEACEQSMPRCVPPVCQRCGVGLSAAYNAKLVCRRCREVSFAFERARSPLMYFGAVREAVQAFKYRGRRRIGLWLAERMAQTGSRELPLSDITRVVPVPRHWTKERLRGLNPAAFLADAVATLLKIPYEDKALVRTRWTKTQTRLSLRQRVRNVEGAFRAHPNRLMDQAVLLIDDVFTSGATAQTCALTLREAGVKTVFVLTAACALPP